MTVRTVPSRRRGEAGFTLVELIVAVAILGVITVALTGAVIVGLRTTDATAASSSRSIAVETLASFFTADAQSADEVSTTDPDCASGPVFLHLTWTDSSVTRSVSYGLDPPIGPDQDLVRWSCFSSAPGDADRRILGHLSGDVDPATPPVFATCDGTACPAAPPGAPAVITLEVESSPTLSLTVHRRAAA